jgi:hypothetical protein
VVVVRKVGESNRLPIHGKIKAGKKGGAQGRQSIRTWRFHSPDRLAVEILAETYGGSVTQMTDPKANPPNQWEVITRSDYVRVMLPPGAIRVAEYELNDKGKLKRRCDGETVTIFENGWASATGPCKCEEIGRLECKPTVMLDVIIPEIANVRFSGVWRFITHSWYALDEIPAMEAIIQQMQQRGIAQAELTLNERTKIDGSTKKVFVVAGLRASMGATAIGTGEVREALAAGPVASIGMGTTDDPPDPVDADDGIIEAQVITEDELLIGLCDVILFDQQLPNLGGERLLLSIAESIVGHSAHFPDLASIPAESWSRISEAVRGVHDGSLRLTLEGGGVKVTRKAK